MYGKPNRMSKDKTSVTRLNEPVGQQFDPQGHALGLVLRFAMG